jgi:hypothetical protein
MDLIPRGFKYVSVKQDVALCVSASLAIITGFNNKEKK